MGEKKLKIKDYGRKKLFARTGANRLYGYDDLYGKWVIEPKFDEAWDFREGVGMVKLDGKYGYIKPDGSYLVEPKFDYAWGFSEGVGMVKLDGKYGYIKPDGSYLVEPKFDRAENFNDGKVEVRENNTYKVLLPDGKFKEMSQLEEYIVNCDHHNYDCYGWSFLEASQKNGKWIFDSWYRLMNDNREWYDMRYEDEVYEHKIERYYDEVGKNDDFAKWANSLNLSSLEEVGKLLWTNAQFLIKEAQRDLDDGGYEAPLYTLSVYLQLYNQLQIIESLGLMDLRTQLGLPEEKEIYLDPVKLKAEAERLCDEAVESADGFEYLNFTELLDLSRKPGDYDYISDYEFNYED